MITERCIQNIEQIVVDHGTENSQRQFSHDDIEIWFKQNREESIQLSIAGRDSYKIKTMLWNLDNLKVHVRSQFKLRLLHVLQNDSTIQPCTEEPLPESLAQEPSSGEKEFLSDDVDSVEKMEIDSLAKPPQTPLKNNEDWFDRMLDIVAAVVRGFMFNTM